MLINKISNNPKFKFTHLTKAFKAKKEHIFHADDVPKSSMSQIHVLILQLFAQGILGLTVLDTNKIGNEKLRMSDITVILPVKKTKAKNGRVHSCPEYMCDDAWANMNVVAPPLEDSNESELSKLELNDD